MQKNWVVVDGERVVYSSNSVSDIHDFAERFATVHNRAVTVMHKKSGYSYEIEPVREGKSDAGCSISS